MFEDLSKIFTACECLGEVSLTGSNNASEYANVDDIIMESNVSKKHILDKAVSTSATGTSPATSIGSTSTPYQCLESRWLFMSMM